MPTAQHILTALNGAIDAAVLARENATSDTPEALAKHRSFADTVALRCLNVRTACEAATETRGDKTVFRAAGDELGDGLDAASARIATERAGRPSPAETGRGPDKLSAGVGSAPEALLDSCSDAVAFVRRVIADPNIASPEGAAGTTAGATQTVDSSKVPLKPAKPAA